MSGDTTYLSQELAKITDHEISEWVQPERGRGAAPKCRPIEL